MRLPLRRRPVPTLPGVTGTARVERRLRDLVPRLQPGDVAVLDQVDLDRGGAQALVDARVSAVVNASPMISGRYPNLGPEVLARAGVLLVDTAGASVLDEVRDGASVRVHDGTLFAGQSEEVLVSGRQVDAATVEQEMTQAQAGVVTQLETLTRTSAEFLRREQDVLLHGLGLPRPATPLAGRPVVVVATGRDHLAELRGLRDFLRQERPVLIAVDGAADVLTRADLRADIVVISGVGEAGRPAAAVLKQATDVVVRVERGTPRSMEWLERLGVRPLLLESSASAEDAALVLAHAGDASVIVGVGLQGTLADLLDRQRSGSAGTFLTRLTVGPRLVDAGAVASLRARRPHRRRLVLAGLATLAVLGVVLAVTPAGRDRVVDVASSVGDLTGRGSRGDTPVAAGDSETAGTAGTADAALGDAFAAAAAPGLYAGRLTGHSVALLVLPGADEGVVDGLTAQVAAAGGTLTGRYDARAGLVDARERSLVDTLGSQLMTQLAPELGAGAVDPAATTYARIGQLLGVALATTDPAGAPAGPAADAVRQSLGAAKLLTSPKAAASDPAATLPAAAPLVLVVLGAEADADPQDAVLGGLVGGLAARAQGVVVAGDTASGADGGVAGIRDDQATGGVSGPLSTVDGVESTPGQVAAVLALVAQTTGTSGAFGATGAQGPLPLG